MFHKAICLALLCSAALAGAEAPEWSPIDEYSVSSVRERLYSVPEKQPAVTAVSWFSHGSATGGQEKAGISLVNTGGDDAAVLVEFIDKEGQPLSVPTAKGTAAALLVSVPSGTTFTEELVEGASSVQGWVRVTTNAAAGLLAQVRIASDGGTLSLKAERPHRARNLLRVEGDTALLSLVNVATDQPAEVRLSVQDGDHAEPCAATVELAAGQQRLGELAEVLPCWRGKSDTVLIETAHGETVVSAISLRMGRRGEVLPMHEALEETAVDSIELLSACAPRFLDSYSRIIPSTGGSVTVTVSASSKCNWTVSGETPGIVVSPKSGRGTGRVQITAHNWSSQGGRQVTLRAGGSQYLVRQQGVRCSFSVNPTRLDFASGGGSKAFFVQSNCHWELSESAGWIQLDKRFGFGVNGASVSVTPTTRARDSWVTVADKRVQVRQKR